MLVGTLGHNAAEASPAQQGSANVGPGAAGEAKRSRRGCPVFLGCLLFLSMTVISPLTVQIHAILI